MNKRIITTEFIEEDIKTENHLRPVWLKDYIGQSKIKEVLEIYIQAARQRDEALDHVLFYGPPGLGKTTLAGIIANEMGVHMKVTSGPAIERPGRWIQRRQNFISCIGSAAVLVIGAGSPVSSGSIKAAGI